MGGCGEHLVERDAVAAPASLLPFIPGIAALRDVSDRRGFAFAGLGDGNIGPAAQGEVLGIAAVDTGGVDPNLGSGSFDQQFEPLGAGALQLVGGTGPIVGKSWPGWQSHWQRWCVLAWSHNMATDGRSSPITSASTHRAFVVTH